jgi:hypothetical protein
MALPSTPEPKGSGNYFKPAKDSKTRVRILSDFIEFDLGWLNKVPVRKPVGSKWNPSEHDAPQGQFKNEPRMAWACEVYNYVTGRHQVWEIPQPSVRDELRKLDSSPYWGDLRGYDIEVTRVDGAKVTYSVMGIPNTKERSEVVEAEFNRVHAFDSFYLLELMTNGDPYAPKTPVQSRNMVLDSDIPF